jgi:hypothetical protein
MPFIFAHAVYWDLFTDTEEANFEFPHLCMITFECQNCDDVSFGQEPAPNSPAGIAKRVADRTEFKKRCNGFFVSPNGEHYDCRLLQRGELSGKVEYFDHVKKSSTSNGSGKPTC